MAGRTRVLCLRGRAALRPDAARGIPLLRLRGPSSTYSAQMAGLVAVGALCSVKVAVPRSGEAHALRQRHLWCIAQVPPRLVDGNAVVTAVERYAETRNERIGIPGELGDAF